jgi:IS1 family transposase
MLQAPAPVSTSTHPGCGRIKAGKFYCRSVRSAEQDTEPTMNALATEKQTQIISALTEGMSIRSASRVFDVHRDTIGRLALTIGDGCERLHDRLMRDLQVNLIELDEQWDFVAKKQKRVRQDDPSEMGDCWLYVALAATQKAVISYQVGKRNDENMREFLGDLHGRILNRAQITSDGYPGYPPAMAATFGTDVDFATIVKHYAVEGTATDAAHRYSPSKVTGSERTVIRGGQPKSTSARHMWSASIYRAECRCAGLPASRMDSARNSRTIAPRLLCGFASTISAASTKHCA